MTADPVGDALRADAEAARAEIRAAGIYCPSCGISMADLPGDHMLELGMGGVGWVGGSPAGFSVRCAAGVSIPMDGASFGPPAGTAP
jgi:hypothetical protein